jgi:putative hydrolase of HD superfamily
MKTKASLQSVVNFIFEAGILRQTPRSGLWFVGSGKQSVAEHICRTALIGYSLAKLTKGANIEKTVLLCLTHDLGEARTSDLNYVHQKYGRLSESQAVHDLTNALPFGKDIRDLHSEAEAKETLEAKLAKDADNLEWICTLREEEVKGNIKATSWLKSATKRLKTPVGKNIVKVVMKTHPDDWWYKEDDRWFVDRKAKDKKWSKNIK